MMSKKALEVLRRILAALIGMMQESFGRPRRHNAIVGASTTSCRLSEEILLSVKDFVAWGQPEALGSQSTGTK